MKTYRLAFTKKSTLFFISIIMLGFFISINSCSDHNYMNKEGFDYNSKPIENDNNLIKYVIKDYMKVGIGRYHVYYMKFTEKEIQNIKIEVDRIFYSPDSLKFIGWLIIGIPDSANKFIWRDTIDKKEELLGYSKAGLRDKKTDIWKIYPYDFKMIYGCTDILEIRRIYNQYFFYSLPNIKTYAYTSNNKWDLVKLKRNYKLIGLS